MNHPDTVRYAKTHEWAKLENNFIVTGISDHAQNALGDLVYIELPNIGQRVEVGQPAGVVESVKTASDIHAPVSGVVVAVNTELVDSPELVNDHPYDTWIYKIQADNPTDIEQLLSNQEYEAGL